MNVSGQLSRPSRLLLEECGVSSATFSGREMVLKKREAVRSVILIEVPALFQCGEEVDEVKRADDTLSLSELSYQSTSDSGRGGSEFDVNNAGHKEKGEGTLWGCLEGGAAWRSQM